jgi:hypothetical protein
MYTIKRYQHEQMSFVQHCIPKNKHGPRPSAQPKKKVLKFRNTYRPVFNRSKIPYRFQSTEPGETKSNTTKTRQLDRFHALKLCLNDVGTDGMFSKDKKIDQLIKQVKNELWAKSKTTKEEWVKAWDNVLNIQKSMSDDWYDFKTLSVKIRNEWTLLNELYMNVKAKQIMDKQYKKASKEHRKMEEGIYESTRNQNKNTPWAKKWRKAVRARIRAKSDWNDIFGLSTWKAGMEYDKKWTPPLLEEYNNEQNEKGNTDYHDAQIKIRSWARLVIEKFLVDKKIEVFYLNADEGEAGVWETVWVYSGPTANTLWDESDDHKYDEGDDRLYVSKIDPNIDKPEGDFYDFIPLNLLRIEPSDEKDKDTIRFPQKNTYEDIEEDPDTLDSDDAALDDEESEEEDELIGEIGIVVYKNYAYIGEITGKRPTPSTPRTPTASDAEESDTEESDDEVVLADMFEYQLKCGSDHVTEMWEEGDIRYFLGSMVTLYVPDNAYHKNDSFMGVNIVRTYTKLQGLNAGKEVAVLANDKEKTFDEMRTAEEQAAINRAEQEEEDEDNIDATGDAIYSESVFNYTDTDGFTYKVKIKPHGTDKELTYLAYKTIDEFKTETK